MGILDDIYSKVRSVYNRRKVPGEAWDDMAPRQRQIRQLVSDNMSLLKSFDLSKLPEILTVLNQIQLWVGGPPLIPSESSPLYNLIEEELKFGQGILDGKFNYINHPKKSWYSNNYSQPAVYTVRRKRKDGTFSETKYDINHYETIKIRAIIGAKLKVKGYPLAGFKSISFDSGVSLWIPNFYEISFSKTMRLWADKNSQVWRTVLIQYVGSPRVQRLLGFVPWVDAEKIFQTFFRESAVEIDIFENMAFFNTMHDALILANWDSCSKLIESF